MVLLGHEMEGEDKRSLRDPETNAWVVWKCPAQLYGTGIDYPEPPNWFFSARWGESEYSCMDSCIARKNFLDESFN